MQRIVSLLPSCTEFVCALGAEDRLVGRSHECDFPEGVKRLPACTRARVDSSKSGSAIDQDVKSLLGDGLSLYEVDLDLLRELRPDLILTQAQCEVCAVSLSDIEKALSDWTEGRPKLISLSPQRFADLWDDFFTVGEALGLETEAPGIVKEFKTRCVDVIEKACQRTQAPSVACIEWIEPLMAAGNWIPEMVQLAGGQSLFGEAGKHSPYMNWEALVEHDPEAIVLMPCGFDIARTRAEMKPLTAQGQWRELRAVKEGRVYLTDGNQYFNRPGPRLVDSLEMLAEMLHPELFPEARHRGVGWIPWEG